MAVLSVGSKLRAGSAGSLTQQHIACLEARDLDCLMAGYSERSKLIVDAGALEGPEAIREFWSGFFEELASPGSMLEIGVEEADEETVRLNWDAETADKIYGFGFSTILAQEGKIGFQIFGARVTPKIGGVAPKVETRNLDSFPSDFVDFGGIALFFAQDHEHGAALWRSDGTAEGTRLVKDIIQDGPGGDPEGWVEFQGNLYFCSCRNFSYRYDVGCRQDFGLWRTDGTAEGTFRVKALHVTCGTETSFGALDDAFFFSADDGTSGQELWKSDGTPEGTVQVKDIRRGAEGSAPQEFARLGENVIFAADDGKDVRLWRSDGTDKGTVAIKKLTGGYDGWHWAFAEYNGLLLFTASDGKRGGELWRTDGTPGGTRMVKELRPGPKGAQLFEITELDGVAYFSATDGKDREVWRTNGTEAGTFSLDVNPEGGSYPDHMAVSGKRIYFYASDKSHGGELWALDGSVAGTYRVKDIFRGDKGSHPNLLVDLDGTLIFVAEDEAHGMELWRSDGSAANTVLLRDICPGPDSGRPREMARVGDAVYFQANDCVHGVELWRTDGTSEGTILVRDLNTFIDGALRRPSPEL